MTGLRLYLLRHGDDSGFEQDLGAIDLASAGRPLGRRASGPGHLAARVDDLDAQPWRAGATRV